MRLVIGVTIFCCVLQLCVNKAARAENSSSKLARGYAMKGRAEFMNRDVSSAIRDCSKALQLDPSCQPALYYRYHAYIEKQAWKEALADCQQDIKANGASVLLLGDACLLCKKLGRKADAEAYKKRMQTLNAYNSTESDVSTLDRKHTSTLSTLEVLPDKARADRDFARHSENEISPKKKSLPSGTTR